MNRTKIKIITGAVILILLLLMLFNSRLPFGKRNSSFAADPGKDITGIEFSQGNKKLSLEKDGDEWTINGKPGARKNGILFMIRILREMKIKSTVSDGLFSTEITEKSISPVKVKVYSKRKLISSFLVYKTGSNLYGNIMKIREGSKPFIVYVPGFDGDIGSGFTLNDSFWKPFTIFNLLPSEVKSVDFENMTDTANSFSITCNNHTYFLSDRNRNLSGWDSALVSRYISYFTWVPFESWASATGKEQQGIIESKQPRYRITVKNSSGKQTILTLWEKMAGSGNTGTIDSDRMFGKTQDNDDLFIVRYFDLDPLLKKRSYFFTR